MTVWFHTTILATSIAATVAVGIASAAILTSPASTVAPKADRLPVIGDTAGNYFTVETRMDGVSVLKRVPAAEATAAPTTVAN
jgi:hypothetical protein